MSSAKHDALVACLASDHALLLDVLRRAWPQVFNGAKDTRIATLYIEHPIFANERLNVSISASNTSRGKGGWVVGFVDLAVGVRMTRSATVIGSTTPIPSVEIQEIFFLEAKSGQIRLGELLRQINLYRAYGRDGYWVVVGPDDRYAELLRSQDIAFIRMMVPQQREA